MIFSLLSKFEICAENPEVCKMDFIFILLKTGLNQSKGYGCICLDLSLDLLSILKISGQI